MPHPNDPTAAVSTERVLSADPRKVFAAFEQPDRLARWWGPNGFTNTFERFEFRPGGRWIFVMHGPKGASYPNESVFREIQPDARIVIEHVVRPWYMLTVTLTAREDRTHLAWVQEFESPEIAARMRPLSEPANEQNLDRLESLLASESHNFQEETMDRSGSTENQPASERIDTRIAELEDWRGETLRRMRALIREADPDVVEEWKWAKASSPGTPVWSHDGIICTGESYKSVVKLTFAKGASLEDPAGLFNSSLDGNVRRAIDIREGEEVDADAFRALIRAAVALNASGAKARARRAK